MWKNVSVAVPLVRVYGNTLVTDVFDEIACLTSIENDVKPFVGEKEKKKLKNPVIDPFHAGRDFIG